MLLDRHYYSVDMSLLELEPTLQRLASKVWRYRHHVINFQTYLSCGRAPKGLRSSCRPAVSLDLSASEINILQELQNAHFSAVLQLSLTAARRS